MFMFYSRHCCVMGWYIIVISFLLHYGFTRARNGATSIVNCHLQVSLGKQLKWGSKARIISSPTSCSRGPPHLLASQNNLQLVKSCSEVSEEDPPWKLPLTSSPVIPGEVQACVGHEVVSVITALGTPVWLSPVQACVTQTLEVLQILAFADCYSP
jgi:hypothetical protein